MKRIMRRQKNPIVSSFFFRWSGLTAALGGVLFAVWGYVHKPNAPPLFDALVGPLSLAVPLLFLMGFAGLYVRCKGQTGWLGTAGFILAFAASVWGAVWGAAQLSAVVPNVVYGYIISIGLPLSLATGWFQMLLAALVLIGLRLIRIKGLRGLSAVVLAMGGVGWLHVLTDPGDNGEGYVVHALFGLLFSLGWVVLGCVLWNQSTHSKSIARSR